MRNEKEISADLKGWFNNYLRGLQRKIDALNEKEIHIQEKKIQLLENDKKGQTGYEWLQIFFKNYVDKMDYVCLWIIKQGYINAALQILESEIPEIFPTAKMNKL